MLKTLALGAAALALCLPGAAFAQSFDYYFGQAQDQEHSDFHEDAADAHAEAHERGFSSPEEHEAWHENAARAHEAYHQDHPYAGYGDYYGGYRGYYPYSGYYHRRHYYGYRHYRPGVSIYWGY
jgi:hypothetical protein